MYCELQLTISVAPVLCDECTSDDDCGPYNDYYMTCDATRGKCICGAHWSDTDGDATNGCEAYTAGTPVTDTCPYASGTNSL